MRTLELGPIVPMYRFHDSFFALTPGTYFIGLINYTIELGID